VKKVASILLAFLFVFTLAPVSTFATPGDKNCSDFSTWEEAQRFYEENGGPDVDPHDLDRDGDGLACDTLRGFNPNHKPGSFVGGGEGNDDSDDNSSDNNSSNKSDDSNGSDNDSGKTEDKPAGGKMPKTAANEVTLSLVGAVTAVAGIVLFFVRRRAEQ
jgi:LPXTG-motif cell wall-anchored protein